MSPRVLASLERFLDNPSVCPHGYPIPSVDGLIREPAGVPLGTLPEGTRGTVVRVSEEDDKVLAYFGSLHLMPGSTICVKEVAPFGGPLLVTVSGVEHAVSREVAALVFIEAEEPSH